MQNKPTGVPFGAEFPVAVIGNPQTSDFELVDIGPNGPPLPLSDDIAARMCRRGLYYLGTVCVDRGAPRAALDEPLSGEAIAALASAYISHVEGAINNALEVAALQRLYEMSNAGSCDA